MATGSIPMVGGHGTAGSFGPLLEQMGAQGRRLWLLLRQPSVIQGGQLIGRPIARYLIDKDNLSVLNVQEPGRTKLLLSGRKLMLSIKNISFRHRSAFGGNGYRFLDHRPDNIFGVTFPSYIRAMLGGRCYSQPVRPDRKVRSFPKKSTLWAACRCRSSFQWH